MPESTHAVSAGTSIRPTTAAGTTKKRLTKDKLRRFVFGTREKMGVGQQIVITRSFNGFINYPFTGLRWFSGTVGFGVGVFLLFMWMDVRKKQ